MANMLTFQSIDFKEELATTRAKLLILAFHLILGGRLFC